MNCTAGFWRRVRTLTVLQLEAAECGAAALAIILAHHRKFVPLEELRDACGVSRDGSKASNMVRAARSYGLTAKGFRLETEHLRSVPLPAILHWQFDHFVVLEGFNRDAVFLNDPAEGPRKVNGQALDESFTGIVLTFEPGPDFHPGGRRPRTMDALRTRFRGAGPALLFALFASLALVLVQLVVPVFIRLFIDNYLNAGQHEILGPLLVAMALVAAFAALFTYVQQHALLRLETRLAVAMSSRFFWHLLRLPLSFFGQRSIGEIGTRVAINDSVAELLSGSLASNLLGAGLIVLFVALMARYDVVLTLIAVTFALLNIVALRFVARERKDLNQRLLQQRGVLNGMSSDGLRTIETLKAAGSESDFFARWSGHQAKVLISDQRFGLRTQILNVVPVLLAGLNTVAILSLGGLRVINGALSVGTLVAFQVLATSFIEPVNNLVGLGANLQQVEGGLRRLDDVLQHPPDPLLDGGPKWEPDRPPRLSGRLELRDVTFGYGRLEPPLIEKFSLTLEPGRRVALVGASGSGKSTIARLIAGLYEPWDGEVLFDGQPRRSIPRVVMTSSLAIADQDIAVFHGSITDNLTMWDASVPLEEVLRAAQDALLHDEIAARPGGYAALIEEDGRNFSGGQRQRIEIARALVTEPSILVLDEATSALDPITELRIDANIRRRGCTCVVIAHRLSTIRDCDEIIVLEHGKVVQRGDHDAMIGTDGPYARLMRGAGNLTALAGERVRPA